MMLRRGGRLWDERRRLPRFLISRVLWRSGAGLWLPIRVVVDDGIPVRFSPTALAAALWLDPGHLAWQRRLVRDLVTPGSSVIDVGANIGLISLVAGDCVGPSGSVLAIEPSPQAYRALTKNVRDAGMPWVRCIRCAVGARVGEARLAQLRSDDQNFVTEGSSGVNVEVRPLDELAAALSDVSLVKVDVEGLEEHVLRGAAAVLDRAPHLLLEVEPALLARAGSDPAALFSRLRRMGFALLDAESAELIPAGWQRPGVGDVLATRSPKRASEAIAVASRGKR